VHGARPPAHPSPRIAAAAAAHDFEVPLGSLPFTTTPQAAALHVRDIWAHADKAPLPSGTKTIKMSVGQMDSAFLLLSTK
jgi:hypothetical protein